MLNSESITENQNPTVYKASVGREVSASDFDDSIVDPIDDFEVFEHIKDIHDPEHPL
ncbi:Hypothetical protein FKW44_003657, partial [Caligus rogercresseyi]